MRNVVVRYCEGASIAQAIVMRCCPTNAMPAKNTTALSVWLCQYLFNVDDSDSERISPSGSARTNQGDDQQNGQWSVYRQELDGCVSFLLLRDRCRRR